MTIGIVTVIPGGVLAVADGRTSMVIQKEVVSDSTRKIIQGPGGTTLIAFGVTNVTAVALGLMQAHPPPKSGPEAITLANACLAQAWRAFVTALGPDVDRTNSALRAAFVMAGVDQSGPYIGAAMVSFERPLLVGPAYGTYNNVVLGAEKYGSSDAFIKELNEALKRVTPADTPIEIGHKIVDAAANTVRAMAQIDPTVGGQTHYRMQFSDGTVVEANL